MPVCSVKLTPLECAVPNQAESCTISVQITPLESALTNCDSVSPLDSALTKNRGEGGTREEKSQCRASARVNNTAVAPDMDS